tara:strand:- start:615 stop:1175 length:561 start_codon:yes stop_codon:yes gene_type:complete
MKRIFDISLSILLILLLIVPMFLVAAMVRLNSKGPSLYWSNRVGKNNIIFMMPKFRSMNQNTAPLASHLMEDINIISTPFGRFIRRTSIDELPQLYSVLKGDMSLVGPRPALFNQDDLIKLRTEKGLERTLPGITGWAQVNGRDNLSIENKVILECEYLNHQSFWFDLKILWMTFIKVFHSHGVSH